MISQNKGFSLLEMLVVLVVVGVVVSGASVAINYGGVEKELDKSVERFVAYCEHAADTAVFDGEPVGLILVPPSWREDPFEDGWEYRWQKLTYQGWVDLEQLEMMELEPEFELAVTIENELWQPNADDKPEILLPAVVFYPGGDLTHFEIEFSHRDLTDKQEHVIVDEWGRVVWEEKEAIMKELEEELDLKR